MIGRPKLLVDVLDLNRRPESIDYIDVEGKLLNMNGLEDFLSKVVWDFKQKIDSWKREGKFESKQIEDFEFIISTVEEINKDYFKEHDKN